MDVGRLVAANLTGALGLLTSQVSRDLLRLTTRISPPLMSMYCVLSVVNGGTKGDCGVGRCGCRQTTRIRRGLVTSTMVHPIAPLPQ